MQLPRFRLQPLRFTVAILAPLVAVAMIGVGIGFPIGVFQTRAIRHERSVLHLSAYVDNISEHNTRVESEGPGDPRVKLLRRRATYHLIMHNKWWLGSEHPWSSVPADPPEPEE